MAYQFNALAVTKEGGILDIVLNRPEVRNAISHEMQDEIDKALEEAETDDEVRAVMLRGSGKDFCAGHDLKELGERLLPQPDMASNSRHLEIPRAWYFRKPLIGGVHGYVGAYAVLLVGCCDFNIAAEGTKFSFEIRRLSLSPPGVDLLPLYLQLPMRVIEKLWLFGGWMGATEAHQFQFVQRVVPEDQLYAETRRWAEYAALLPPVSFRNSKERIRCAFELMGIAMLPPVLSRFEPSLSDKEPFWESVKESSLRQALRERNAKFDPDIARV